MSQRLLLLRALLIAAALPAIVRMGLEGHPRFVVAASAAVDAAPLYEAELLPSVATQFVHAATLAELPSGDLAAAWYGGSAEARGDVVIFLSLRDHRTGRWSPPRVIEDRVRARRALGGRVKSIGNPVLFADARGVRLFYVAIIAGGWSGGTICMKSSPDAVHWSGARHVDTSPLFNAGMLVRGAPTAYDDGTIALPVYHQLGAKWSAIARVDDEGGVLDEVRIEDRRPLIQPWLVVTAPDHAVALFRNSSRPQPFGVAIASTADAGEHWSEVLATPLAQRDSGVAGTLLGDGSLLAFYNHTDWSNTAWNRRDLSMARSIDGGRHWSWPHPFERDTASVPAVLDEYSYPYAIRTRDGRVHVVYTWKRTRVRHVTFNDAWARSDPKLAVMR